MTAVPLHFDGHNPILCRAVQGAPFRLIRWGFGGRSEVVFRRHRAGNLSAPPEREFPLCRPDESPLTILVIALSKYQLIGRFYTTQREKCQ